jgi:hypothetical protein
MARSRLGGDYMRQFFDVRTEARTLHRRDFMNEAAGGVLLAALATLLPSSESSAADKKTFGLPRFPARARHIIYMHHIGAPSQIDLFDYKPQLEKWHGTEIPASVRGDQRLTAFTADQKSLPITASKFHFSQHGQSAAWLSELLPHHSRIVDDVCFIRSMHTEAINHVTGASLTLTGSERAGRPSIGAWVNYGLGKESEELPAFVVLTSRGSAWTGGEALQSQLWSNGFLPAQYQGVQFRSTGDPVLYLSDPPGVTRSLRTKWLDTVRQLNGHADERWHDPEISARVQQFETAFRMQQAMPELVDTAQEPPHVFELYGEDARRPGSFAANCLLARRLVERGVRFVQLFHRGWDHHERLNESHPLQARDVDQASAALVLDLKQRGLLDETLVVWGSEFGRTVFCQGDLSNPNFGRDHHPRCFTVWLAGGGVRGGMTYGTTDDYSYNIVQDPVHIHDLNATLLHCLGVDHERLTFRHQGRDFRLTDVGGAVVRKILG